MSRAEIKASIQDNQQAAARAAAACRLSRKEGTLELSALCQMLRVYILQKYRLDFKETLGIDGEEITSLDKLAELSLDKMQRLAPDLAAIETQSATCDGADSTTTKQALLMMAIQRDFEVTFNGFDIAFAESVEDIARLIWSFYESGSAPDASVSAKFGAKRMGLSG